MKFKPTQKLILVQPDEAVKKTESGIIIPDQAVVIPNKGTVLDVGPDCQFVKNGDHIVYGKSAGFSMELDDNTFRMMEEKDILLIKKPETNEQDHN